MNLFRGAIAGGLAGLVLALTFLRLGPQLGLWLGTVLASASFGLIFGVAFLGAHDGTRKLPLWSVAGWAAGGLALCGLAQVMPMRSMGTSLAIISSVAGLLGGAGFGFGWGSKRGAVMIGVTSFVILPFAMFFGWWCLSNGAMWMASKGFAPNRVIIWTLALSGFITYGATVGVVSSFCGDAWEPDVPVNQRLRELEQYQRAAAAPPTEALAAAGVGVAAAGAVHAGTETASSTPGFAPPAPPAPPQLDQTSGSDALSFDTGDVALTPYEEVHSDGTGSFDDDDDMFFGAAGGKSAGTRNLHPDYASEVTPDDADVGIGGFAASVTPKHDRIEVDLEDGGDASIDMSEGDEDDEYGFLYE